MIQDYQAIYNKYKLLTKYSDNNIEKLGVSLMNSRISINPHQINTALFYFKHNFLNGVMFADEVGLGKTIEAGLVISQMWAEHKRNILIVAPASLLKQWNEELFSKFFLNSTIIDGSFIRNNNLLEQNKIYIVSYHTVYLNKAYFNKNFSLVLFDEAHKLRNVYKDNNLMANSIKNLFKDQKKIFLTATPFQNNLLELYGLISILDDKLLGNLELFKNKYINNYDSNVLELKTILSKVITRTLRKDVQKYINFTNRLVTESYFKMTKKEIVTFEKLIELVYSNDFAMLYEAGQRQLIVILLQKLMSSSFYAINCTLQNIISNKENTYINTSSLSLISKFINHINNLQHDSKLEHLIHILNNNIKKKILIFTEYKSTQDYLYNKIITKTKYKVLKFNGENNDSETKKIYEKWLKNTLNYSNNKSANIRMSLVEAFKNDYDILIATDAACEGLNLQFCSLIINYDLPWNPQKIEQRIGRCHRFGQKDDVIVINILSKDNEIDLHIYNLLKNKSSIFESTFASSDLVLSDDEICDNIEKSITTIFKKCRSKSDIIKEFESLQAECKEEIKKEIDETKIKLISNFDKEVQEIFDNNFSSTKKLIDELDRSFLTILEYVYKERFTRISELDFSITSRNNVKNYYTLNKQQNNIPICTLNDEIGSYALNNIPSIDKNSTYRLHYSPNSFYIGYLDRIKCKSGYLLISNIESTAFNGRSSLVLSGMFDDGSLIPEDVCIKLLLLSSEKIDDVKIIIPDILKQYHISSTNNIIAIINEDIKRRFKDESDYINNYIDTKTEEIQIHVEHMRLQRKELQIQFDTTSDISERMDIQNKIKDLSKKIKRSWFDLAEEEERIEEKRLNLLNLISKEKEKKINIKNLVKVRFEIYE